MSTESPSVPSEYEFSEEQNQLIGSLSLKMGFVGLAMLLFGGLQMVNGIVSFFSTRNPDKVLAAAREAGMAEGQLEQLQTALASGGWFSPIAISSIAFALAGLLLLLVGLWTRQAGLGFAGIVATKGQDISRLMDALGSMHKKYSLMSTLLWVAVISSLVSLLFGLYHHFAG